MKITWNIKIDHSVVKHFNYRIRTVSGHTFYDPETAPLDAIKKIILTVRQTGSPMLR